MPKRRTTAKEQEPWHIKCRVGAVGEEGPLIARHFDRILSLGVLYVRGAPKGLNLDGLIIIDMQADGGVDQIEILEPLGGSVGSKKYGDMIHNSPPG